MPVRASTIDYPTGGKARPHWKRLIGTAVMRSRRGPVTRSASEVIHKFRSQEWSFVTDSKGPAVDDSRHDPRSVSTHLAGVLERCLRRCCPRRRHGGLRSGTLEVLHLRRAQQVPAALMVGGAQCRAPRA